VGVSLRGRPRKEEQRTEEAKQPNMGYGGGCKTDAIILNTILITTMAVEGLRSANVGSRLKTFMPIWEQSREGCPLIVLTTTGITSLPTAGGQL
jgi:hypothetical protein